jgi:hypothetical protein
VAYQSLAAKQVGAMKKRWPQFLVQQDNNGTLRWTGSVKPFSCEYTVQVVFNLKIWDRPLAIVLRPELSPREGGVYEDVPHLMFDPDNPKYSALCLFDPNGNEWNRTMMIADTTIPWTCEWLRFYEIWHATGVWHGRSIGFESVSHLRRTTSSGKSS